MVIVLMGPPGCGKGTISSFLSEKHNFCHISTGDLIRKEIKDGGDFARKINEYVLEGKLVPDEITNEILKKNILSNIAAKKDIILDGYPRNLEQAKYLENIIKVDYVLNVKVDFNVITKRILGRRSCPTCGKIYNVYYNAPKVDNICDDDKAILVQRTDDNEETINKRVSVFNENNKDLFNFYKEKGVLHDVENDKDIQHTEDQVKKILNLK